MTLKYVDDDILKAKTFAIVNPVNCVGVMGKGLALQFRDRWPQMFLEYQRDCERNRVQIGSMHTYLICEPRQPGSRRPHYIVNFPTKRHWRDPSQLDWIAQGLEALVDWVYANQCTSIAIPALGCGEGGLPWSKVDALIRAAFESSNRKIRVYPPK
jgi:O-acetyl-ADP-ribose deacetylase (regulator of RNase III)